MEKILLAKSTNRLIDNYLDNPSHGVMIVGKKGSGKSYLAQYLVKHLLNVKSLDNLPYFIKIAPVKNTISIDTIRELQSSLKLMVPNNNYPNRVVLIEDAGHMTDEAQNALLKTLEEPAVGTVLILTATNEKSVLDTIASRTQIIKINKVSAESITNHFANLGYEKSAIEKAILISDNRIGLIKTILDNNPKSDEDSLVDINNAKMILGLNRFDRLVLVNDYKDRDSAIGLVDAFCTLSRAALVKSNLNSQKRWQKLYKQAYQAKEQLIKNAGTKIVLTNLFYEI